MKSKGQCRTCIFYDEQIDEYNNEMDDCIVVGEPRYTERHYCMCYQYGGHLNRNNIPPGVWKGQQDCEKYLAAKQV